MTQRTHHWTMCLDCCPCHLLSPFSRRVLVPVSRQEHARYSWVPRSLLGSGQRDTPALS